MAKMKLKTLSGAKKRFKMTASGKIKRNASKRRHILTKKTTKLTRGLPPTRWDVHAAACVHPASACTTSKVNV